MPKVTSRLKSQFDPSQLLSHFWHFLTNRYNLENIAIACLILIAVVIIAMESPISPWRNSAGGTDKWVFQTVAYTMQHGGMPYLDSFDHKGPLLFIINFLGLTLHYYRGVWLIELVFLFGTFILMYKIARLCCRKITALCCVLASATLLFSYFEGGNLTEEYAMFFIALALYIFLQCFINRRVSKIGWVLSGASLGCVLLLRANMIAVWIIFCPVIFFYYLIHKKWSSLRDYFLYFCLGFFVVLIPTLIWLAINGAFGAFFEQYIIFNLHYSNANPAMLTENRWNALFYFCQPTIILLTLFCVVLQCSRLKGEQRALNIVYLIYLACTLLLICLPGQNYRHYAMIIVPAVVYPLAQLVGHIETSEHQRKSLLGAALGLYILVTLVAPSWLNQIQLDGIHYKHRHENQIDSGIQSIVNYIQTNTTVDDSISVFGNINSIYILSQRLSASKYSYQAPIGHIEPRFMDEYFADLATNQPAVIVVDSIADGNFAAEEARMQDFLQENNYQLRMETTYEDKPIFIYSK